MARCLNSQYVQIWLLGSVFDSFLQADNEYQHDLSLFWVWRIDKLKIIQIWLEIEFSICPNLAFRECFRFVFACWWRISGLSLFWVWGINMLKIIQKWCLNFQYVQIRLLGSVFDFFLSADNEYRHDLSLF